MCRGSSDSAFEMPFEISCRAASPVSIGLFSAFREKSFGVRFGFGLRIRLAAGGSASLFVRLAADSVATASAADAGRSRGRDPALPPAFSFLAKLDPPDAPA